MIEKTVVAVREQREILTGDGPLEFYRAPAHPLVQELRQLPNPLEKEEQLRRQRESGHVLVEARQERILLRTLQDQGRVQPAGQTLGEARLADADRAFDDDVVIFRERHVGWDS